MIYSPSKFSKPGDSTRPDARVSDSMLTTTQPNVNASWFLIVSSRSVDHNGLGNPVVFAFRRRAEGSQFWRFTNQLSSSPLIYKQAQAVIMLRFALYEEAGCFEIVFRCLSKYTERPSMGSVLRWRLLVTLATMSGLQIVSDNVSFR